uniref:Uncharacterized protein n=1 Tax=Rhizophora mucronata TaxID=61149 RepID=A0A2P2KSH0_RHIMU
MMSKTEHNLRKKKRKRKNSKIEVKNFQSISCRIKKKMDLISRWNFTAIKGSVQPITTFPYRTSSVSNHDFSVPIWRYPFRLIPGGDSSVVLHAKKKASQPEPVLKPSIVEEVSHDNDDVEEDQLLFDDFDSDGTLLICPFDIFSFITVLTI